jgi:hypothetical protein
LREENLCPYKSITQMFITTLYIITQNGKKPIATADKQTFKKRDRHAVEHYSAIKRNEVLPHDTTWMNLENIE